MVKYTNQENLELALFEYELQKCSNSDRITFTDGKLVGYLADSVNNATGNGEQFYTSTNGEVCVPLTASEVPRSSVKEITILMTGSTEPLGEMTG